MQIPPVKLTKQERKALRRLNVEFNPTVFFNLITTTLLKAVSASSPESPTHIEDVQAYCALATRIYGLQNGQLTVSQVVALAEEYVRGFSESDRESIFGGNAAIERFFSAEIGANSGFDTRMLCIRRSRWKLRITSRTDGY